MQIKNQATNFFISGLGHWGLWCLRLPCSKKNKLNKDKSGKKWNWWEATSGLIKMRYGVEIETEDKSKAMINTDEIKAQNDCTKMLIARLFLPPQKNISLSYIKLKRSNFRLKIWRVIKILHYGTKPQFTEKQTCVF